MKLPHIHFWRRVILSEMNIHRYYECRCGKRKVERYGCCQPIHRCWLQGGDATCEDLTKPPPKPMKPSLIGDRCW